MKDPGICLILRTTPFRGTSAEWLEFQFNRA
jgi:hypothetical protein